MVSLNTVCPLDSVCSVQHREAVSELPVALTSRNKSQSYCVTQLVENDSSFYINNQCLTLQELQVELILNWSGCTFSFKSSMSSVVVVFFQNVFYVA